MGNYLKPRTSGRGVWSAVRGKYSVTKMVLEKKNSGIKWSSFSECWCRRWSPGNPHKRLRWLGYVAYRCNQNSFQKAAAIKTSRWKTIPRKSYSSIVTKWTTRQLQDRCSMHWKHFRKITDVSKTKQRYRWWHFSWALKKRKTLNAPILRK